jgi:SiaC family regulatory phosphoprotein
MKPLKIEATRETPEIILDPDNDLFHIKGVSHPENIKVFFSPILQWLDQYFEEIKNEAGKKIVFKFYYKYINSSSLKHLYDFLQKLTTWRDAGIMVEVDWNYADDDEDMMEAGEELSELKGVNLPFRYLAYTEEHDLD